MPGRSYDKLRTCEDERRRGCGRPTERGVACSPSSQQCFPLSQAADAMLEITFQFRVKPEAIWHRPRRGEDDLDIHERLLIGV